MALINKQPFITPEMIDKWNAGISRQYSISLTPSDFTAWGSLYFKRVTYTTDIDLTNRKVFVEADTTVSGNSAWACIDRVGEVSGYTTKYQISVLFIRPTVPASDVTGKLNVLII